MYFQDDVPTSGSSGVPACSVNKAIQLLAQKYCVECNSSFDELSKIIQVYTVMKCPALREFLLWF